MHLDSLTILQFTAVQLFSHKETHLRGNIPLIAGNSHSAIQKAVEDDWRVQISNMDTAAGLLNAWAAAGFQGAPVCGMGTPLFHHGRTRTFKCTSRPHQCPNISKPSRVEIGGLETSTVQ